MVLRRILEVEAEELREGDWFEAKRKQIKLYVYYSIVLLAMTILCTSEVPS